jgi:hypothetical protein
MRWELRVASEGDVEDFVFRHEFDRTREHIAQHGRNIITHWVGQSLKRGW